MSACANENSASPSIALVDERRTSPRRCSVRRVPSRSVAPGSSAVRAPAPESIADDRGGLQHHSVGRLERIEPGGDQGLHGVGHRRAGGPSGSPAPSPASAPWSSSMCTNSRAYSGFPPARRRSASPSEVDMTDRTSNAPSSSAISASVSGDSEMVVAWATCGRPARPAGEQLRARRAQEEERHVGRAFHQPFQELEQRLVGPVQVLDDGGERTALGGRPRGSGSRR